MLKAVGCYVSLFLVTLLSRQASGTFHPLALKTPSTSKRASHPIGSRPEQPFDPLVNHDSDCLATVYAIRGGSIGSAVSGFNGYIGASKARSWVVLAMSILADTVSVALMKSGQDEASAIKVFLSFFGFGLSLAGFGLALKAIDVSMAYAVSFIVFDSKNEVGFVASVD